MNNKNNIYKLAVLSFAIIVLFIIYNFGNSGHYGYDDMNYARIANNINQGETDYSDHYTYRWALTYPTALSYKIFGINDFASSLPSILYASLLFALIYLSIRKEKIGAVIVTFSLAIFSNWNLVYSIKLMPDIAITFSIVALVVVLFLQKFKKGEKKDVLYATLLSISFLIGFLAKGTIILALPLLGYFAIYDIIKKQNLKFWISAAAITSVLFLCYLFFIEYLTGNLTGRFNAIASNSYLNKCSFDQQPISFLIKRISFDFFDMIIKQGMAIPAIFLIAILSTSKKHKLWSHNSELSFFTLAALLLWLSSNFMTISFTHYNPLCIDPRHYLFIIPITAIAVGYSFKDIKESNSYQLIFAIGMLIIAIATLLTKQKMAFTLYLPIAILAILYYLLPKTKSILILCLTAFTLILGNSVLGHITYAKKVNFPLQRQLSAQFLEKIQPNSVVISDEVQKRFNKYFLAFKYSDSLKFLNFDEAKNDTTLEGSNLYVIDNKFTQYLSGLRKQDLPNYLKISDTTQTEITSSTKIPFKIIKIASLQQNSYLELVLNSKNNLEKTDSLWVLNLADKSKEEACSKPYSNKVNQYSSTFKYNIPEHLRENNIHVNVGLNVNLVGNCEGFVVVSLEDENGIILYEQYNVTDKIKAFGNWKAITFGVLFNKEQLKTDSFIKVYVVNNNQEEMYIDDFEVEISRIIIN